MALYTVTIGGQPVEVLAGSLTASRTVGKRSTASFVVKSATTVHFRQFQQVAITDNLGSLIFTGYVYQPQETKPGFQPFLISQLSCIDQRWLADKRVVSASYTNKTVGFMVQDIANNILSQEGVTIGNIYDGLLPSTTLFPSTTLYPAFTPGPIPASQFNYCTVSQALDALVVAASSGGQPYYWCINRNKQLYFVPYTAITNSNVVDGTMIEARNNPPTVIRANALYRNSQMVVGGVANTGLITETRTGNGNTQSWTMQYALSDQKPTISVDSGAGFIYQTVGLQGVSTGFQWYWTPGSYVISQDTSGTKLTSSQVLQVSYIGQYPTVISAQNAGQIAAQGLLDGSSGIVDAVDNDSGATDVSSGYQTASTLLTRYGVQAWQLTFWTLKNVYNQGELVLVNLPDYQLNNVQMLVETVTASDNFDGLNIWYVVQGIIGPADLVWQNYYASQWIAMAPTANITVGNSGTSGSTAILVNFTATLTAPTATVTETVHACPLPSTSLFPSTTLFPC